MAIEIRWRFLKIEKGRVAIEKLLLDLFVGDS
jgi:hypothetical protein